MKKFVARKNRRITIKFLVLLFLFIFLTITFIKYIFTNKLVIDKEKATIILSSSINTSKIKLSIFDFNSIDAFLKENIIGLDKIIIKKVTTNKEITKSASSLSEPLVYIYNTHQTEEYAAGSLKNYNITPTVYMAANILKETLKEYGINAVVEDSNLQKSLSERGLNYNNAYTLSYEWLEMAKNKYPTIEYFIDLHRDSVSSSIEINNYPYAKMMFVIGMNHENYKQNEALMLKLNELINNDYEGLMRTPFYGKNSRYNQHFNENVMLIEIGGPESTINEVSLSIKAFAESLTTIIGEDHGR
ncbi:MAG: stage II sporulation protein P [bacterium]|nr:stage II sporulation protein P [bacterium]